jgi:para-nitrobenzyl esterase
MRSQLAVLKIVLLLSIGLTGGCIDNDVESLPANPSPPPLGIEVALDSGIVRGQEHPESEVWEWLGIPFAQSPVGYLRWRATQPIAAWEGVREKTTFGERCPQLVGDRVMGDEDCLHLNVWRPRTQERGLPVYVRIHGGSIKTGTDNSSVHQGDRLAVQSNMVVES